MAETPAYQVTDAVGLIADKWTLHIFTALCRGHNRFGQFQRAIPDITRKMLMQTLRKMQRDGLIERIDYNEAPRHVEYKLTTIGDEFRLQLTSLCQWSKQHFSAVEAARQAFDGDQNALSQG
jgi:DNA-binding HxlR family transcriptional regulator